MIKGLSDKQKKLAIGLFDAGIIQFDFEKGWKLKLHEQNPNAPLSPIYIDLRKLQSYIKVKKLAVEALADLSKNLRFDCLAGIPLAAVALTSSLADKIKKTQITPRLDKKTHGQTKEVDGDYKKGGIALVVDDLITKADSKLEAIELLERNGLKVKDVLVIIDRQQGGVNELAKKGCRLHSVFKIKPILRLYKETGKITAKELKYILNYLDNPL